MSDPTSANSSAQQKYQVRFDWAPPTESSSAPPALPYSALADADVVVWVDVLANPAGRPGAIPADVPVIAGGFSNASAVAQWILAEQERLGRRAMITVLSALAAGSPDSSATGPDAPSAPSASTSTVRVPVENLLGAGAIVDALAEHGLDYSSPEAAAACSAFVGLRRAVSHLLSASVRGQQLRAQGVEPETIAAAAEPNSSDAVRVLT